MTDDNLPQGARAVTQEEIDEAQGRVTKQDDFVGRMQQELKDLMEKVHAADKFIKSQRFSSLTEEEQRLLRDQLGHMEKYGLVLAERISLY